MRNYYRLSLICIFVLLNSCNNGCGTDSERSKTAEEDLNGELVKEVPNQIIFKFDQILSDDQIRDLILQTGLNLDVEVESCKCGDPKLRRIKVLDAPEEFGDLLTAVSGMGGGSGGGMTGDYDFVFEMNPKFIPRQWPIDTNRPNLFSSDTATNSGVGIKRFISPDTDAEVIVILDSGIDLLSDESPFKGEKILFENPEDTICNREQRRISGWNFVSNDYNIQDYSGHGTYVTNIIVDELKNTHYRILPLKISNRNNKVSYWDLVCAMSFIEKIQSETGKIKLVNASFGFKKNMNSEELAFENYQNFMQSIIEGDTDQAISDTIQILTDTTSIVVDNIRNSIVGEEMNIFREYVEELSNDSIIFVTAAGNLGQNIDDQNFEFYPAEFTNENIVVVGGYDKEGQNIERNTNSNYSNQRVDVGAPYNYFFKRIGHEGGTSFSSALISAQIFKKYNNNWKSSPRATIDDFLIELPDAPSLVDDFKAGKYVEADNQN